MRGFVGRLGLRGLKRGGGGNAYLPGVFDSLPGAEITQDPNNEETRNEVPV